jgi:hypothetical protein
MLKNAGQKMKLRLGNINTRVRGNLTATASKDNKNINTLMNMHSPPTEGNSTYDGHIKSVNQPLYKITGTLDIRGTRTKLTASRTLSISRCIWI